MAQVTIYSTPTCGYCKMAKAFFQENNVAYEEKDVSVDAAARDAMVQKSGQLGVPVIDVDGDRHGGGGVDTDQADDRAEIDNPVDAYP